ncbi:MAG: beta-lactamase [Rickettsiaceae bacterium]|jgi:glyoxylase-like metal-dependent hydrolase (beta-lactamase superfamily II)|nr:beta-lactamase [Rickettsiaceae bacterium]
MQIKAFFDPATFTISYIVTDEASKNCAIIDPVLDYDIFSGKISTKSADNLISFIQANNLQLEWILETHIHADHLTGASYIKEKLGNRNIKIAIGEGIFEVLNYWVKAFNVAGEVQTDGKQFSHIFKDGEVFKIGNLEAKFLTNPGHTPACGSYLIDDAVFVGDLMFMPALGTGRADFPGGDAKKQFSSIQKIFSLPENTKIFTGHDYPKEGEQPNWESTIAEQKAKNVFAKITNEGEYIEARTARDKNLAVPKLLFPAIQINLRCGQLPKPEQNGTSYLKLPLTFC